MTLNVYKKAQKTSQKHLLDGFKARQTKPQEALLFFKMKALFANLRSYIDNLDWFLNQSQEKRSLPSFLQLFKTEDLSTPMRSIKY